MAVIEFEGEVAGVVVDAYPTFKELCTFSIRYAPSAEAFEKGKRLLGVFEMSQRFRLEPEVEIFAIF